MLFLGSNIGNFEASEAVTFLRAIRKVLRPDDALLLGADLKKDRAVLEAAYNDALGVTRAFIVNELARINRELDGNFDLWAFGLRSVYNEAAGCVDCGASPSSTEKPPDAARRGADAFAT